MVGSSTDVCSNSSMATKASSNLSEREGKGKTVTLIA